jgi:hypothetical protein
VLLCDLLSDFGEAVQSAQETDLGVRGRQLNLRKSAECKEGIARAYKVSQGSGSGQLREA